MYWQENWEVPHRNAKGAGNGKADKRSEDLLDAVLENSAQKERPRGGESYAIFPTPAFESRFKSCLARVPVECRMEQAGTKRILALRPKNVQNFDELIRTSGLANCEAATQAVNWLRNHPDEFLRFDAH